MLENFITPISFCIYNFLAFSKINDLVEVKKYSETHLYNHVTVDSRYQIFFDITHSTTLRYTSRIVLEYCEYRSRNLEWTLGLGCAVGLGRNRKNYFLYHCDNIEIANQIEQYFVHQL